MKSENPFSPVFPVRPKFFLNRIHILDSFRKAIKRSLKTSTPTPDNIAIFGSWGLGKSSLFRKFESILSEEFPERCTFFSLVEITPPSGKDICSLICKIVEDVERNFNISPTEKFPEVRKNLREWREHYSQKENITSPVTHLMDALLSLWNLLQKSEIDTAVLMLDDLHYLSENHPEYLYDLLSIFQSLPKHGCNFILCTTSQEDTFLEIASTGPLSRFFNLTHILSPFQLEETKNAIVRPILLSDLNISLDEAVVEKIHQLTQGHPFFIHFIMRELLSSIPPSTRKISLDFFEENYPQIKELLDDGKFKRDFSLASEKERKILLEVANLGEKFSPSEIMLRNARSHLRFLLKKNLIKKHERGKYSLYHPLFKEYLGGLMHG